MRRCLGNGANVNILRSAMSRRHHDVRLVSDEVWDRVGRRGARFRSETTRNASSSHQLAGSANLSLKWGNLDAP